MYTHTHLVSLTPHIMYVCMQVMRESFVDMVQQVLKTVEEDREVSVSSLSHSLTSSTSYMHAPTPPWTILNAG